MASFIIIACVLALVLRWGSVGIGWPLHWATIAIIVALAIAVEILKRFLQGRDRTYVQEQLQRRYGGGKYGRQ
jgi:membrane protein implicated in regulation of membrane protease activity